MIFVLQVNPKCDIHFQILFTIVRGIDKLFSAEEPEPKAFYSNMDDLEDYEKSDDEHLILTSKRRKLKAEEQSSNQLDLLNSLLVSDKENNPRRDQHKENNQQKDQHQSHAEVPDYTESYKEDSYSYTKRNAETENFYTKSNTETIGRQNAKQKFHHGQATIGNLLMIRQLSDHNNQPIAQQNKETGNRLAGRR